MLNIFKRKEKIRDKVKSKINKDSSIEETIDTKLKSRREKITEILLKMKINNVRLSLDINNISIEDVETYTLKNDDILTIIPININNHLKMFGIDGCMYNITYVSKKLFSYILNNQLFKANRFYQLCIIDNKIKIITGSKKFDLEANKTYHIKIEYVSVSYKKLKSFIFTDVNIDTNYSTQSCKKLEDIINNLSILNNMDRLKKSFTAHGLDFNVIKNYKNEIRKNKFDRLDL